MEIEESKQEHLTARSVLPDAEDWAGRSPRFPWFDDVRDAIWCIARL